jgi:hypothetical protein
VNARAARILLVSSFMRALALHSPSFLVGIAFGVAVAFFAAGALRRRPAARAPRVIDGAKPADPVALDARPLPDASRRPLESESFDVDPQSQRW